MSRLLSPTLFVLLFGMLHHVQAFVVRTTAHIKGTSSQTVRTMAARVRVPAFRLYTTSVDDENKINSKKRLVFLGTPDVAAASLQTLYEASQVPDATFEISAVVTQPPKRRRRKGKPEPSPVGKVADELGIPLVLCPEKAKDPVFLDQLATECRPDLCITAAYGQYLPKRFLSTPPLGTLNIHPSLLPRWRGASPVQRSLEAGDQPLGVSILYTVSKMDAGPIVAQLEQSFDENDSSAQVLPQLFILGTQLLLDNLPDVLEGRLTQDTATPQDESLAVPAPMIHSSEGELKVWSESARTCHNKWRGFAMWPGVFMYLQVGDRPDAMKIKIIETRVVSEADAKAELTNVVQRGPTKKSGLYVVCYDGSVLELLVVQPATKKAFAARDFANGYPGETIRWVPTPEDQAENPAKYNSNATAATATTTPQ